MTCSSLNYASLRSLAQVVDCMTAGLVEATTRGAPEPGLNAKARWPAPNEGDSQRALFVEWLKGCAPGHDAFRPLCLFQAPDEATAIPALAVAQ